MKGSICYSDAEGMTRDERRWWLERVTRQLIDEKKAVDKAAGRGRRS